MLNINLIDGPIRRDKLKPDSAVKKLKEVEKSSHIHTRYVERIELHERRKKDRRKANKAVSVERRRPSDRRERTKIVETGEKVLYNAEGHKKGAPRRPLIDVKA